MSAPFIREDLSILRSHHHVIEITSSGPLTFLKYLRILPRVSVTFSWFASVYSSILVFFCSALRKKSILILGGVDVAQEREYNYGIWNSRWKAKLVRYGITHADAVIAVDESLKQEAVRLCRYDGHNISVIPTGYDADRWFASGEKRKVVLSVGTANDLPRFKKKGYDLLFALASELNDVDFLVIGISDHLLPLFTVPSNVRCISAVPQADLLHYYQSSKVFTLLSRHEGLPNALCEAMLCECVPVGSNKFGIPNGIGDAGFIVDTNDMESMKDAIRLALHSDDAAGKSAREQIMTRFPLEQRKAKLLRLLDSMIQ